jgi:tetratricopeptide (TPR) repeat protein
LAQLVRVWLREQGAAEEARTDAWAWAAGAAGGLWMGLGATFWSQSLAAKGGIYTLQLALVSAALLALWRWSRDAEARLQAGPAALLALPSARLCVLLLAVGLGGHWETQILILPAVGLLAGLTLWPRWKALRASNASEAWSHALLPLLVCVAVGVSFYLYLPLRARLDPVLNWGDPRDWQQFWWVFQRQEYLDLESGFVKSLQAALLAGGSWSQVAENWAFVQRQGLRVLAHLYGPHADLGLACAALSLVGLWAWRPGWRRLLSRWALFLAVLASSFILIITFYFHLKPEMVWILDVFLLPAYLAQAAFAALGALWLWRRYLADAPAWLAPAAALLLLPVLIWMRAPQLSQAQQYLAWDYGQDLLLSCRPHAIVLAEGDFNTMPVYYLQHVAGRRKDIDHLTTVFLSTDWGAAHARRQSPRLGIGELPKAATGARAGDAQVLRAALSQIAQASAGRPIQSSLFREELRKAVPEWEPGWRPHGLVDQLNGPEGPAEDAVRANLLSAFRTRSLALDRATLDPSPSFALSNYASAFMELANRWRDSGRVPASLPLYARGTQWASRDNLAEVYTHWGIAVGAQAQRSAGAQRDAGLAAAAEKFQLALQSRPIFEAYANLAGVRNQQGQISKRVEDFHAGELAARAALAIYPDSAQAANNLAIALYYQGKAGEALQVLQQAARLAPQDPQIQGNLKALGAAGAH